MVEAESEVLHGADGDGVVALGVGEHHGLFFEAADAEDGRLGLVDDGRGELVAEDAGVGEREGGPADFVGREFLGAGALGEIGDGAGQIGEAALLGLAHDGHDESPLERHGDAEMDVLVVADARPCAAFSSDALTTGIAPQRLDGRGGDEGHVGELDAVALLESGFLAVAQARDARHVDFVDGVDVGADAHALDHALGNDGAHAGERHQLRWDLRAPPAVRQPFGAAACAGAGLAQGAQDIFFADAALGAGAGDLAEVDAVFFGDAARQRRGADAARRCHLRWGELLARQPPATGSSCATCGAAAAATSWAGAWRRQLRRLRR